MITVQTDINSGMEKVWECWTKPEHITQWNFASEEWHCPSAFNDLRPGGNFNWRMEAKDMSAGFFFTGTYTKVVEHHSIEFNMSDGRKVEIKFTGSDGKIRVTESFEAEGTNADEQQKVGWQAILNNFRDYVESINN